MSFRVSSRWQKLKERVETARREIPADQEFSFFANEVRTFLDHAENILDARIAAAKSDHEQAISYWEKGVEIEDALYYGEPPDWFYPVRDSLGAALLVNGQAEKAEAVFRADFETIPRKSQVAVWSSECLQSAKEAQRRGKSPKRIWGSLEECGYYTHNQ